MRKTKLPYLICCAFVAMLLFALTIKCDSGESPEIPPDKGCEYHLRDIGTAIAKYHRIHKDLPAVVLGPDGLQHSWRALIAPYILERYWEIDYRINESWDSPHNRKTLSNFNLQYSFCCASDRHGSYPYPYTSYLMLVRPAKMYPLPSDAILIVESAKSGIKYAEPRDLLWEDLWKGDSPFGIGKLYSLHPKVVKALRVDGKVIDIPKDIDNDSLRKLLQGERLRGNK
jgi:hypothetical protein